MKALDVLLELLDEDVDLGFGEEVLLNAVKELKGLELCKIKLQKLEEFCNLEKQKYSKRHPTIEEIGRKNMIMEVLNQIKE